MRYSVPQLGDIIMSNPQEVALGRLSHPATTAQWAAFALFEALRAARGLAVSPGGDYRLTFLRALNPAAAGLAWTDADDDALQLRWGEADARLAGGLWAHATCAERGPVVSLYLQRDRPVIQARFAGAAFVEDDDGRYRLRERLTFSSHDGLEDARRALALAMAEAWRVPMDGAWLHVGHWDPLEGAWDAEAARRLVAAALIAEAARTLEPFR